MVVFSCIIIFIGVYLLYRTFRPSLGKKHKPVFTGVTKAIAVIAGIFILFIGVSALIASQTSKQEISEQVAKKNSSTKSNSKAKEKHVQKAKSATTSKKVVKYLKQDQNISSYIKNASVVDGVLTIHLKDIRSFDGSMGAVDVRRLSEITGTASKTSLAKNGVALVQRSKYIDGNGNKKTLMDFAVYYSKSKIDQIDFSNYPSLVQHNPKQMFNNADGYYLQKDFVKGKKSKLHGIKELMKTDDKNLMIKFMDKFGA